MQSSSPSTPFNIAYNSPRHQSPSAFQSLKYSTPQITFTQSLFNTHSNSPITSTSPTSSYSQSPFLPNQPLHNINNPLNYPISYPQFERNSSISSFSSSHPSFALHSLKIIKYESNSPSSSAAPTPINIMNKDRNDESYNEQETSHQEQNNQNSDIPTFSSQKQQSFLIPSIQQHNSTSATMSHSQIQSNSQKSNIFQQRQASSSSHYSTFNQKQSLFPHQTSPILNSPKHTNVFNSSQYPNNITYPPYIHPLSLFNSSLSEAFSQSALSFNVACDLCYKAYDQLQQKLQLSKLNNSQIKKPIMKDRMNLFEQQLQEDILDDDLITQQSEDLIESIYSDISQEEDDIIDNHNQNSLSQEITNSNSEKQSDIGILVNISQIIINSFPPQLQTLSIYCDCDSFGNDRKNSCIPSGADLLRIIDSIPINVEQIPIYKNYNKPSALNTLIQYPQQEEREQKGFISQKQSPTGLTPNTVTFNQLQSPHPQKIYNALSSPFTTPFQSPYPTPSHSPFPFSKSRASSPQLYTLDNEDIIGPSPHHQHFLYPNRSHSSSARKLQPFLQIKEPNTSQYNSPSYSHTSNITTNQQSPNIQLNNHRQESYGLRNVDLEICPYIDLTDALLANLCQHHLQYALRSLTLQPHGYHQDHITQFGIKVISLSATNLQEIVLRNCQLIKSLTNWTENKDFKEMLKDKDLIKDFEDEDDIMQSFQMYAQKRTRQEMEENKNDQEEYKQNNEITGRKRIKTDNIDNPQYNTTFSFQTAYPSTQFKSHQQKNIHWNSLETILIQNCNGIDQQAIDEMLNKIETLKNLTVIYSNHEDNNTRINNSKFEYTIHNSQSSKGDFSIGIKYQRVLEGNGEWQKIVLNMKQQTNNCSSDQQMKDDHF